jgi:hypothetical protein
MVLVKSLVAGVVAAFIAAIGTALVMVASLLVLSRNLPEGHTIGWDPVSFGRQSFLCWLILVGAFVFGFVWEYRRAV